MCKAQQIRGNPPRRALDGRSSIQNPPERLATNLVLKEVSLERVKSEIFVFPPQAMESTEDGSTAYRVWHVKYIHPLVSSHPLLPMMISLFMPPRNLRTFFTTKKHGGDDEYGAAFAVAGAKKKFCFI
jgi:hypothetical protein